MVGPHRRLRRLGKSLGARCKRRHINGAGRVHTLASPAAQTADAAADCVFFSTICLRYRKRRHKHLSVVENARLDGDLPATGQPGQHPTRCLPGQSGSSVTLICVATGRAEHYCVLHLDAFFSIWSSALVVYHTSAGGNADHAQRRGNTGAGSWIGRGVAGKKRALGCTSGAGRDDAGQVHWHRTRTVGRRYRQRPASNAPPGAGGILAITTHRQQRWVCIFPTPTPCSVPLSVSAPRWFWW